MHEPSLKLSGVTADKEGEGLVSPMAFCWSVCTNLLVPAEAAQRAPTKLLHNDMHKNCPRVVLFIFKPSGWHQVVHGHDSSQIYLADLCKQARQDEPPRHSKSV